MPPRLIMRVSLGPALPCAADAGARRTSQSDAEGLAQLMLDAYRGTTDDEGGTIEDARTEVRTLLAGGYGDFDADASEVVERDNAIVAATLVTRFRGTPFVAFSMTAPSWKRRGLAKAGLVRVMNALAARGESELRLVVTRGNDAAETLYRNVGFRDAERAS